MSFRDDTHHVHDKGLQCLDLGRPQEVGPRQRTLCTNFHLLHQLRLIPSVIPLHLLLFHTHTSTEPSSKDHGLHRRPGLNIAEHLQPEPIVQGFEGLLVNTSSDGVYGSEISSYKPVTDELVWQEVDERRAVANLAEEEPAGRRNVGVAGTEEVRVVLGNVAVLVNHGVVGGILVHFRVHLLLLLLLLHSVGVGRGG